MSWTRENYPKVREHLADGARQVFDRMANEGLRIREGANGWPTDWLLRCWAHACQQAGATAPSCHVLRLDYITTAVEARRG
ncbi:hypothetical protein M1D93_14870 [Arthrobacter sp. Z1-9]